MAELYRNRRKLQNQFGRWSAGVSRFVNDSENFSALQPRGPDECGAGVLMKIIGE
jgi:hypothetical protein